MIRASELGGRAVVDLEAAEKLGRIEKVILDPDARRVAGFVVARGGSLFGQTTHVVVPASAVHAVGPDAVTVHQPAPGSAHRDLEGLPCAADVIGRKVVSTEGRLMGVIDDVLISDTDGRIVGYELTDGDGVAKLGQVLGHKERRTSLLRADVPLRAGRDLVVAPADAVSTPEDGESVAPSRATQTPAEGSAATAPGFPYSTSWFQRADDEDPDRRIE